MAAPAVELARSLRVAVVVPALNEERALPATLASVRQQVPPAQDVLVVDAGSEDGTAEVARGAGARVVSARRGRAWQMNAGAAAADAEVLLFLHADTQLQPGALAAVLRALEDPRVLGGCFQLRFDAESQSIALFVWGLCTRLSFLQTPRLVFGDRAIFVRRSTFQALEGYREWPLLEDVDFAMRLHRLGGRGSFAFLPLDVTTSARRLLQVGPVRQQLLNTAIILCWYFGVSPATLKEWYRYTQTPAVKSSPGAVRKD